MPEVTREKEMNVPLKALYTAITEFESYPVFLPEVVGVKVVEKTDTSAMVDFEIEVVKRFQYSLLFSMTEPLEVRWKLLKSNFFRINEGKWSLRELGSKK